MEVLAAVGLASATVQFVDFSTKIIGFARGIHDSTSGMTDENDNIEFVTAKMEQLSLDLEHLMAGQNQSRDQKALVDLAVKCRSIANDIIQILEKIKPKDSKSKLQSLRAALKHIKYEKEVSDMENRLGKCREQLHIQLSFLNSSETKCKLDTLVESSQGHEAKLEKLQDHYNNIRNGVATTSLSATAQQQLQNLLELSEDTCRAITQNRILNILAVKRAHRRFDSVEDAHHKTFKWIWKDRDIATETNHDQTVSEPFLHWLTFGDGAFHISGKLGSGKSTLMKFLCEHERTRQELEKWADGRKLVFEKFFFWKLGEDGEKSLDGLFRSLLYHTLESCPELIPQVLPDLWEKVKCLPWQVKAELQLSPNVIRSAFTRLIAEKQLYQNHCFCYFIDGLDEYEERREDYKDLVKLLLGWTSPDVKICVSSREDPVFMNAFAIERRLRLQDLTRGDMLIYVVDRLELANNEESMKLVDQIVDKSSGIFLWLTLVIKLYRQHTDNGSDIFQLDELLHTLPTEIEDLFRYLLKSLEKDKLSQKRAYRTFAIVLEKKHRYQLPLFGYSFFEEIENNPNFAIQKAFPCQDMEDTKRPERIELAKRRVNGYCKGLIEIVSHQMLNGIGRDDRNTERRLGLEFTHRSFPEFLASEENEVMRKTLDGFNASDSISQIWLAHIRASKQNSISRDGLCSIVLSSLTLIRGGMLDAPPHAFLECLSSAVIPARCDEEAPLLGNKMYRTFKLGAASEPSVYVTSPLWISACYGRTTYAYWKMENNAAFIHSEDGNHLLNWCLYGCTRLGVASCETLRLISSFLSQGLSPQAVMEKELGGLTTEGKAEFTFWVLFLIGIVQSDIALYSNKVRHLMAATIEKFLECGADPDVLFSSLPGDSKKYSRKGVVSSRIKLSSDQERRIISQKILIEDYFFDLIPNNGGTMSARELIKLWKFDNEERIMQLLDRNMAEQEKEESIVDLIRKNGGIMSFRQINRLWKLHNEERILQLSDRNTTEQEKASSFKLTTLKDFTSSSEDSETTESDTENPEDIPPMIDPSPVLSQSTQTPSYAAVEFQATEHSEKEPRLGTPSRDTTSSKSFPEGISWSHIIKFLLALVGILVAILIAKML